MAIYALSDLHLPLGIDKPMNVFGAGWENYVERIEYNWKNTVSDEDFVIINGDFSWATYLEESIADFSFIEKLPGTKLLSKGNHDYWWTTLAKLEKFKTEHEFSSVHFLQNNAFLCGDAAVCGSRGWISPLDKNFKTEDKKIYMRELMRLEASLKAAAQLSETIVAALHYPPDDTFVELMVRYNVHCCVFGHLHGRKAAEYRTIYKNCSLVSADFLKFTPKLII